jgi:lipoprotein-anchoring transpeptidase ErfK/SrfK
MPIHFSGPGRSFKLGPVLACFQFIAIATALSCCPHAAHARATTLLTEHNPVSVAFPADYPVGMIIIKQSERRLYYITGPGTAIAYPIAIGKAGKAWRGETSVQGKFVKPAWSPPADVRHDHPEFPEIIPGGSPGNPMGAAALTLNLAEVAIHGTTQTMRKSIGTAASYGCIRMYNEDVVDLFQRVEIGAKVVSIP